ncbi:glycerophosphodiester phosphodiesterase [Jeotgalibacillus proteolyticus]|uniref:glycerophosphodiester phosphodiesterase n=1 Tax=Jeotgalibacillus proteolyticus TaxID=2082395 RepID=UPI003CEB1E75
MTNVKLFAHRGSCTMCPENTMAAFRQALREGADGIELDVRMSRDGYVVVIHDRTVTRTTNGRGTVAGLTLQQLRSLDAGSWYNEACKDEKIPTLEEVLQWIQATELELNIELKTEDDPYPGIEQAVLDLISEYALQDRIVLSSFNIETLKRLRELDASVKLAYLISEQTEEAVTKALSLKSDLHCQLSFMKTEEAEKAVQEGIAIRLYTVNEAEELISINLNYIEAVITDALGVLQKAFKVGS